jgi:hypothetical protein
MGCQKPRFVVSDRDIEVDNGWVNTHSPVSKKLYAKGYSVGGYIDNGVPKYVLYRTSDEQGRFTYVRIHEFDTNEELNNVVKLLLDDEET